MVKVRFIASKLLLIALSSFFSYFLCLYYLDNIIGRFNSSSATLTLLNLIWTILIFLFLNWLTNKKSLIFTIKIALSVFASYYICYYYIDDILLYINHSKLSFLSVRLLFTILVFIVLNWLTDRNISTMVMDVFFISYLFSVLVISISGNRHTAIFSSVNFNVLNMFQERKLIVFLNTVAYIPLGYYISKRLKFKFIYILLCFIVYICLFEIAQLVLKKGYFDINDIILNSLGFTLGIAFRYVLKINKRLMNIQGQ